MPLRTLRCAIEDLKDWYPRLFLEPHNVACVAVMKQYSASPAAFDVACEGITSRWLGQENALRLEVSWAEETAGKADRLLATMQQKPVVELAAVALAFILARRLLELGALDLNAYGERADYRSLSAECVLEVSGTEDASELGRRHRDVDQPYCLLRQKVSRLASQGHSQAAQAGSCVIVCRTCGRCNGPR
jgi:hypothetical protein